MWELGGANSTKLVTATDEHKLLLTIIMSNERPSHPTRIPKIAGSFTGKLSSLLQFSRAPKPSSIVMDSSFDNYDTVTKWVTGHFIHQLLFNNSILSSVLPPNVPPVVSASTAVFAATEASTVSSPISAPVSSLIHAVPKQLSSTPGPENPPTVSNHPVLTIVLANYWLFSICLRPVVYYHPLHLVPPCKRPRN